MIMAALGTLTVVRLGGEFGRANKFPGHSDCVMACTCYGVNRGEALKF